MMSVKFGIVQRLLPDGSSSRSQRSASRESCVLQSCTHDSSMALPSFSSNCTGTLTSRLHEALSPSFPATCPCELPVCTSSPGKPKRRLSASLQPTCARVHWTCAQLFNPKEQLPCPCACASELVKLFSQGRCLTMTRREGAPVWQPAAGSPFLGRLPQ